MDEDERTREKHQIGNELYSAVEPILARYEARGLRIICAYTLQKPGDPSMFDISTMSTIEDPRVMVMVLAGAAREIKEKMIDAFTLRRH